MKGRAKAKLRRQAGALGGHISIRVLDYSEVPIARRIFAQGMLRCISSRAFSWLRGPIAKTVAYISSVGGLASFVATVLLAGDRVLDPHAEKNFWRRLGASLFVSHHLRSVIISKLTYIQPVALRWFSCLDVSGEPCASADRTVVRPRAALKGHVRSFHAVSANSSKGLRCCHAVVFH